MFFVAIVEGTATSCDSLLISDVAKKFKRIIADVLQQAFFHLNGLLKASLKLFAADMYSHGLISEATKDTANFHDIMREFKSGMYFKRGQKLVQYCKLFLQSLDNQGGQCKDAANYIAEEWNASIKEKLDITIEFDI